MYNISAKLNVPVLTALVISHSFILLSPVHGFFFWGSDLHKAFRTFSTSFANMNTKSFLKLLGEFNITF